MELFDSRFMMHDNYEMYEHHEYTEDNGGTSLEALNRLNYRITIPASEDILMMSDAFLQVRGRIVQKGVTPVQPFTGGKISLVNNGWNLFEEAKYKINGKIIETVDKPGYVRQIKGLIEYSDDYNRGQGKQEMWAPDKGSDGSIDFNKLLQVRSNDGTNGFFGPGSIVKQAGADQKIALNDITCDDDAELTILYDGKVVTVRNATTGVNITLLSKGADGAAVDSLPLGADTNVVEFYVNGKRLRLFGQDGAEITASFDGDQEIKFDDGGLIATTAIANLEYDEDYSNIGFEERRLRSVLSNGYNTNASFELYMPIRRVFKFLETHTIPIKGSSHIIELNKADASENRYSDASALFSSII